MKPELRAKLDRLHAEAEARKAEAQRAQEPDAPKLEFDADLIPDLGGEGRPEDLALDQAVDDIDILDAYRKWCGKQVSRKTSKVEVQVSCPIPGHEDKDPSASINTDTQVWNCYACEQGGDKFDIAAWHFGHGVPGYKIDGTFPELRRKMAGDFGYTVIRSGGTEWVEKSPPDSGSRSDVCVPGESAQKSSDTSEGDSVDTSEGVGLQVVPLPPDEPVELPTIDWRAIVTPDTFLHQWMEATEPYDLPTEFFFWLGCQAVAAACSDDVVLEEYPPVEPNLYVCLTGPTGIGKSRATQALLDQLRDSVPYDFTDPNTKGTLIAKQPASGEALLKVFSRAEKDTDGSVIGYRQVRALVRYDELAALVGRATRLGNTLKPQIISLYDGDSQGDSAITRADTEVENPFCQMVSTTQPGKIRDLLTQGDADSGFINRWIFAMGPAKPLQGYGRKPFDAGICSWELKRIFAHAAHGRRYVLEGDALKEWLAFFHGELEPIKKDPETNPALVRADLTMFKLMVIFAANDLAHVITVDHVRSALALWPYLRKTYDIVAGEISTGIVGECLERILEVVPRYTAKHGRGPTENDILNLVKNSRFKDLKIFEEAMRLAVKYYLDESIPPSKDGRKRGRFSLRTDDTGRIKAVPSNTNSDDQAQGSKA